MAHQWQEQSGYTYAVAGVMLADEHGNLIGQHRDGNTPNSPNLVSFFGGRLEQEDATPLAGALREVNEETNRHIRAQDLEPLATYMFEIHPGIIEMAYLFVARGHTTKGLKVYEGQGYYVIRDPRDPLIAPVAQQAVDAWFTKKRLTLAA